MSKVRFYLKAEPNYAGVPRVLEFYEVKTGRQYRKSDGSLQVDVITDRVEDSVIKQYPDQHAAFAAYVEKHKDALYERVRAGEVIYCPEKETKVSFEIPIESPVEAAPAVAEPVLESVAAVVESVQEAGALVEELQEENLTAEAKKEEVIQ